MTKLFVGYLFLFLNCNLNLDPQVINIIPDWVGYLILLFGLAELAQESEYFVRVRPLTILSAVFSAVIWGLDAFALSDSLGWGETLIVFIGLILYLMVAYQIVCGILEMEQRWGNLGGEALKRRWEVMAVFQCLGLLTTSIPALAMIFIVLSVVFVVLFLVAMFRAQKVYRERKAQPPL